MKDRTPSPGPSPWRRFSNAVMRRILRRLSPGSSEARLLSDLRHMRGLARLAGVFVLTVLLPGTALAWIGFESIRAEEQAVWQTARQEGDRELRDVLKGTEELFQDFEVGVKQRLATNVSPVDVHDSVSPYLLVALRLDRAGNVAAPFVSGSLPPVVDHSFYFGTAWRSARAAEQAGDYPHALKQYDLAARHAHSIRAQGEASFSRARVLARSGRVDEALVAYADVYVDFADVRDLRGFRLGDLARMKRGELLLQRDPEIGRLSLEALVTELQAERWTLGQGGLEAAVIARCLELLEDVSEKDWLATKRGRLDTAARRIFWAEQLADELSTLNPGGRALPVARGEFRYHVKDKALWATMWWGEEGSDYYAFALDKGAIIEGVRELTRSATRTSAAVNMVVIGPGSTPPKDTLDRRSLAPWLPEWRLVVHPRSAADLNTQQEQKRVQRITLLLLAIFMIAMGAVLTARLVGQELEVARTKADFAANVSHELRSPITQIRVKGEALQYGLVEGPELQEYYDAIVRESERLSRLVDNVLDFAAIERGAKKYMMRPVPIGDTIRSTIDAASYGMELRDVALEVRLASDLPVLMHDPEAIAQVLYNLVSNAAKYGREGGVVEVEASVDEDMVSIAVSDQGIGIAPEDLPHLFEHFFRSNDPNARRKKGTGIGLTIVQYIAQAHGGSVEVESTLGEGSTFTIHLPTKPPDIS